MAPQRDRLVEIRAPHVEPVTGAEIRELRLAPANPEAGDHPAARQRVERGELLREDHGVALGDDDDARAEPETAVPGADPGERLDRVEVRPVVPGRVAVVDEDVVGRPDGVEAELVGRVRGLVDRLRSRRAR